MKQDSIIINKKIFRQLIIIASLLLLLHSPGIVFGQTDPTKTDSTKTDTAKNDAPVVEEESSLISPSMEFISVQKSNNTIDLKAGIKAKVKGTFYNLPLIKISFVQVAEAEEKVLGFVITDRNGKAVFNVKADSLKPDKEGKLHFKAVYAGNKQMEPAEEEVTFKRARLELVPVKEDSLLSVTVKLVDIGTGNEVPIPETALGIFVDRMFNPLKVGEGTTDENGEATIEIPNHLSGDANGNITLIAKLDESELYGNLEANVIQPWGTKVSDTISKMPRALWSSDPPIWMLVTFIILMSIVWGHYLVIIIQLVRLRKEEPHETPNIVNPNI